MTLKPCPFCGHTAPHLNPKAEVRSTEPGNLMPAIGIFCMECPAEMVVTDEEVTPDQVIAMWNKRAG